MSEYFAHLGDPGRLVDGQRRFVEELRGVLARLRPAHVDPAATAARLEEDGTLYVEIPHAQRPDLAIRAWASQTATIVGVDPVYEPIGGRAGARDLALRVRAAAGFVHALLSGFERELTLRDGEPVRVALRVPDSRGRARRFSRSVGRRRLLGRGEVEREWISFIADPG